MGTSKLREGDYCPNGLGGFAEVSGEEAVLERVLFLLTVRRGSFPLLPEVGSRLYRLPREKTSARQALAASYAAEALAGEENVAVTRTEWEEEKRRLTVYLTWQGRELSASVTV